jgi:hypothetical protein
MKTRIFATAILALSSTVLFAQKMTYDAGKTTFGVRAGVNFNNITGKDASGDKFENNINTGFHAGVNAEIPLGSGSYLQPGILYSQKGAEFKLNGNNEVDLSYIEVPVNFLYKPTLGTGRVLLGFGPYVGVGIDGKVKTNGTKTDVEFTNNHNTETDTPDYAEYKRLDYGGNFLAGYEFGNNLSFQVNAQLGLANMLPKGTSGNNKAKANNTGFGVSLGYRF